MKTDTEIVESGEKQIIVIDRLINNIEKLLSYA
jgi:hypothetical protein